jgi:hypothetical protein
MSGSELLVRDYRVRIPALGGGLAEIKDLSLKFEVEKSLKHEPNTCNLRLMNLSPDTRLAIEGLSVKPKKDGLQSGQIRVEIEAGYLDLGRSLIFRGDVRTGRSRKEGPDWVTTIEGEDGGKSVLLGRIARTYPEGTPYLTVIRECARALGLGEGNLTSAVKAGQVLKSDSSARGRAADVLKRVAHGLGLTYSIQNGVLQFQGRGLPLTVQAIVLASGSGLVEVPERDADGKLFCTALMIPGLTPGGRVQLESKAMRGLYQIKKIKYEGELPGKAWYARLELEG